MEKEIIKSINEVYNKDYDMEGYEIVTNKQSIKILIEGGQTCCEVHGYLCSEDDLNEFVGAEIKSISVIEGYTYNKKMLIKLDENGLTNFYNGIKLPYFECGDAKFVDINTNKGVFQIAVYNSHNGYYGHDIRIEFNDIVIEDCI